MKYHLLLAAVCLTGLLSANEPSTGPQLGLQSWTCRDLTFEQTADLAAKHGIKYLQFTPAALGLPQASREELLRKKAYLEERGLIAHTFGVNHCSVDKEANRALFEVAKLFGMKLIIVEPRDPRAWDSLEELVKEYDLRLAIHNHSTGTVYGNPADVAKVLAARDTRIGVCLDIGWATAAGFDAAEVFKGYGDRVYDLHFKDRVVEKDAAGQSVSFDVLHGKGQANFRGVFAALAQARWSGVMAIESDSRVMRVSPDAIIKHAKDYFRESLLASQPDNPPAPASPAPGVNH